MSITTLRMSDNVQASQYGAQAGDILIWDMDLWCPVPGERIYAPYEKQAALNRAVQLDNQLLPDLFGSDLFD